MKIPLRVLCVVFVVAALAALPPAFVAGGMQPSVPFLSLTVGSGAAAVAWLWALAAFGVVRRFSFGVGALVGFLAFAVVLAAYVAQPAAQYSVSWRAAFAAWVLVACGVYPVLVGGVLGHLFRKALLPHAA